LIAGLWTPWERVSDAEVAAFLDRWRGSDMAALRNAYFALIEMTAASFYGSEAGWAAAGYPGPPAIERPSGEQPA
jgi:hypothetical protein